MEQEQQLSLRERLEKLEATTKEKPQKKKLKIPRRAKVRKGKIKKGWVGIIKIDENGNISGEKQKIADSTYVLKDGTTHATDGREILFWNGKFPVVVQETKTNNPVRFNEGENQTYGQKYIKARMLKDAILVKKKAGSIVLWIVLAIIAIVAMNYFFGR